MDKDRIFNIIKRAQRSEKDLLILEMCTGLSILDVGCVGQDYDYKNPAWLHNRIKNVASSIDGVDIDKDGIVKLKESGYSIYLPDELSKSGKKYDVVLMADVIEHVNDPVEFLRFYSSFLNDKGKMIITTPNAHGIRNFSSILIRNNYPLNPEHTFWLCPRTFLEIIQRANLEFSSFYWLNEYHKFKDIRGLKNRCVYTFNLFFTRLRSNFSPNFMIILSK